MSPRSPVTWVPSRGGGGVATWLVTALLVLTLVRPASTSTGEDRLTVAVLPSVVPAGVAGIAITVAGTNFHPGGGDDGADEPAIVCVFAGVEGPSAIVPARLVAGGGASCDVPFNPSPSGFVSVGLSGNGGVDAKFFRGGAGGEVLAFTAPGALRVVGSRTWARGDAAHFAGADMAPRDALGRAAAGDACPCGWRALDGEYGESPGAYVSSAVRTCETSPRFPSDAGATRRGMHHEPATVWVVATLDAAHPLRPKPKNEGESESGPNAGAGDAETEARPAAAFGAASLSLALAEPPAVTRVFPNTVAAEGGATVEVSARGAFGDENEPLAFGGAWARIGTARVAAEPGSREDGTSNVVAWRCVAPARAPSLSGVTVAIAANALGAERVGVEKHRLRSVSALTVAAEASPWRMAFAAAETAEIAGGTFSGDAFSAPITPTVSGRLLAGHHATCILGALGVGLMDHSPDAFPAFAFGRASPRERARLEGGGPGGAGAATRAAYPATGPSGGGGVVWVSGSGLTRGACDFGIGIGIGFGDVLDTRSRSSSSSWLAETASVLVSSALVACEAPALASPGFSASTRVGVLGAAGAAAYRFLPDVSPGYASNWTVEAAPSTGPSRGGTTVTLSRLSRLRHRLSRSASAGFEALAGAAGAGGCRFGAVAVAAREAEADGDGVAGGAVGAVSCVAPAGRPGRVAVAVVDAAPGAACDSGGYAAASGAWRRHRLDDWD